MDRSSYLLTALSEINREFLDPGSNKRSLFKKLLNKVLEITESSYGFIGEVFIRNGAPMLKTYAITNISWNDETAALYKKYEDLGMEFTNLNTLFGYTLRTGEMVISNDPVHDTRRGGLPHGHPSLDHYLGLPIKDKNNSMIGMLGIANKPGGYSEDDAVFLEPMVSLSSAFISSIKANEAKEFFANSLDAYKNAIDSHAIVSVTDVKGVISYVNGKFCEQSKYEVSELIGRTHQIVNSGYHSKEFFQNLWKTILSGKTWHGEIRNKAKDGSLYWVDATIVPLMDKENKPYQFIAIRNDITKLKEQQRELSSIFRLSVDFICIANTAGYFLKVSQSFWQALGITEAEMLSFSFLSFVHPEDLDATEKELEGLSLGISTINFVNRYRKGDGSYLTLSWKTAINPDDGLIYGTASDISEKLAVEEKLIQSKVEVEKARAKDVFLANMSHEIRTPLNAIMGFHELLRKTKLDQNQLKYSEIVSSALKNLNIIINDILDFSKLENGKFELEKHSFKMEALIKQVIQMQLAPARAKNLKLILSYDSEIPENIIGDETRLTQILINLIANAIKFTPKGSVELRVTESERTGDLVRLSFSVKDTGIGIDPSKLEMIFDRFTQAEDYTTRVYGGTGLGLNIVKSLVEVHRGKLDVKSELGQGSEFSFEIEYPIDTSESSFPAEDASSEASFGDLSGIRILIVEDNVHNQVLAKTYLENNNALVEIAGNGLIAMDMLKKNDYSLVLMDVQMPVMDGIAATKSIRNELKLQIPIIGCSAHSLVTEKTACLAAGMNYYITKPYTEKELVEAVIRNVPAREKPGLNDREAGAYQIEEEDNVIAVFQSLEAKLGKNTMLILLKILQDRIPDDIKNIEAYMLSGENKKLESLSHSLSGSFGSLLLMEGLGLSKKLEKASKEGDREVMLSTSADLIQYLKNTLEETRLI